MSKVEELSEEGLIQLINDLARRFGGIQPIIPDKRLKLFFTTHDGHGLLKYIAHSLNLRMPLGIYLVRESSQPAVAWVKINPKMPLFGTQAFLTQKIDFNIRITYLELASDEAIIATIAHELAHVLLYSTRFSPGPHDEKAADLLPMIFGYRDVFLEGYRFECIIKTDAQARVMNVGSTRGKLPILRGYLTENELRLAKSYMDAIVFRR